MKLSDLRHSIKQRRLELHLTAENLANQAKTTKSIILNFEKGKTGLTLDTLFRLCDVLGLEITLAKSDNIS